MRQEEISNFNDSFERYKDRITNLSHEFEFGLFLNIFRQSLPVLIGLFLAALIIAFTYLHFAEPVYSASTKLQLGKSDQANQILNVGEYMADDQLSAELELLRSNLLIAETVKKMDLGIRYYEEGEVRKSEHYRSSYYKVDIVGIKDSSIIGQDIYIDFEESGTFELTLGATTYGPFSSGEEISIPQLDFVVLAMRPDAFNKSAYGNDSFFVITSVNSLVPYFSKALSVSILNPTAKTILISTKDGNARLARDFAAQHAKTYLLYDTKRKEESAENILLFINSQLDTVSQNLRNAEFLLNSFKQEHKITNLSNISNVYLDRMTSYQDDLLEIELQEDLLSEISKVTQNVTDDIDVYNLISLLVGTKYEETVSELLKELQALLKEREEIFFDVTEENKRTKSLDYQIDIQKRLIVQSVNSLKDKLKSRKTIISSKEKEMEETFVGMPAKELEYARYQRLFDINEKYYIILLQKKIEYRISKAGYVSDNKILTVAALSSKPISPLTGLTYISAIGAALLLSVLFLMIRYLVHNNITSLNEIAKRSQASIGVLGLIPKFSEEVPVSQLIVDKNPKSLIAESFRSIRTNMQFVDNEPGSKTVAITSTVSGEGKTFTALNLAGIIAFSGKRVVLLDLDMRKPKIHKGFDVENDKGMSTILIGKDEINDCVKTSPIASLDFITAGPVPPNPSELILSERMANTIEALKKSYDYIVIDNPPVGLVTDGINAIKNADYPIYIFRADYSKTHFVQNVDRLINENGISKLSVILNGVDIERNSYGNYYGYGYGYAYGSSYGDGYYSTGKPRKWWQKIFNR